MPTAMSFTRGSEQLPACMAPPNTASGTVQSPIVPSAMSGFAFQEANSSVQRIAGENGDKDDSLQHQHRRVGQAEPALQKPAAGADSAEKDRNRNNGKRILPRQEGDEDAGETIASREIGVGAALHGSDFDHSRQTGRCACQKTDHQNQSADIEAHDP